MFCSCKFRYLTYHTNGDSNESNCVALCLNCHAIKTRRHQGTMGLLKGFYGDMSLFIMIHCVINTAVENLTDDPLSKL
jgi:hypothetical protein